MKYRDYFRYSVASDTDLFYCDPAFAALMNDYYTLRGWNDDGTPSAATLKRLGLL